MKLIFIRQLLRSGKVNGLANDFIRFAHFLAECIVQPLLDEADCEMGDVDTDPAAIQALRNGDGCAASAEGIKDGVAFIGT